MMGIDMTDAFDDPDAVVQIEDDDPEQLAGDAIEPDPTSDDPDGAAVQAWYDANS